VGYLTIASGATLDLNDWDIILGGDFNNQGTLRLMGFERLYGFSNDTTAGTVEYYGSLTYRELTAGDAYNNLKLTGSGIYFLDNALDVRSDLTISQGILSAQGSGGQSHNVNIGGSFTNSARFITSGTVTFDGAEMGNTITSGGSMFNNINFIGIGSWTLNDSLDVNGSLNLSTGSLAAGSNSITVAGNWVNTAGADAFIPQTSTVIFDGSSGDSTISGSTAFYNLTCTVAGKQLIFEASTTQTIITGGTLTLKGEAGYGNLLVLRSTKSDDETATLLEKEWLINHQGSEDILFVDVKDSHNTNASNWITADKTRNAGNNTNWEFLTNLLTWIGPTSTIWTDGSNWDLGFYPNYGDSIIVLSAENNCVVDEDKTLMDIEIRQGGVLDLDGNNLTLIGGFRNEAGTLKLKGSEALAGFSNDIDSGTVEYTGSWTYLGFNGGEEYFNLNFSGTGTYSLNAALIVNNDLTITNGTLNTGIKPMNIGGSFSNSSHLTAIGVVTFTSTEADETIKLGGSSFYNLVFDGAGGVWKVVDDSLIVDKNLSITRGTLDLNGQNFTLRADEPIFSNQGRLKLTGAETLTNFINDSDSGTVEYYGNSIYDNGLIAGDNYFDLEFSGGGNYSIDSALTVNHQLFLSNLLAVLDSKGYNLTLTSGVPLSNQGTLRLIGQETLTNFVNDTDSG
ncbi:MAG: hypothetical protein KJ711_08450, partial [Candidatus Omnitrophica bacterium]|nr:hypothetical protein [Candidatus Omnitrophota bacterium]